MITAPSFYRHLGLAGGSLWLVEVGFAFAAWSLIVVRTAVATSVLALVSATAVALLVFGIKLIRIVRRLPHEPAADRSQGRSIWRQFGMTVAAEGLGCAAVSVLCSSEHHWKLIVPLILVVVGLHFLPLARLFQVPRYNMTGALFCIIPLATILLVPSSAHIGHALSWLVIAPVGCGLVALATGWAGLAEVRRFLNSSSGPLPVRDAPTPST